MSLHSSLKRSSSATRHRNVLKRQERMETLADQERWIEGANSIYGLPKVRSIKVRVKKKAKKKAEEAVDAEAAGAGAEEAAQPPAAEEKK